jgi:hypothetical protein
MGPSKGLIGLTSAFAMVLDRFGNTRANVEEYSGKDLTYESDVLTAYYCQHGGLCRGE